MTGDLQLQEAIQGLSDAIGLRPGFYDSLLTEPSDWAFLIQLQVVAEAAIAQRVVKVLQQDKVFDHVSRLPLDGKTGKVQLALSLGILDAGSADALRALSACRNRFAHRIASIGATLVKFGDSLDAPTKRDLMRKMGTLDPEDEDAPQASGLAGFGARLRQRLWLSTAVALAPLADADTEARLIGLRRDLERAAR
jgi:hypothetical protein